jgi:hypothetical protein
MTFTWNEIPARTAQDVDASPVCVFVVSTSPELLKESLRTARQLTRELGAQIEVLAPFVVPYPLDLGHPAVEPQFLENKLLENALLTEVDRVHILLCRDEADAVVGALPPKSIVVLTVKKRWWRTREDCLADTLRKAGHHVVIAGTAPVREKEAFYA